MVSLIGQEISKKDIITLQEEMEAFGLKRTDLIIKQTETVINANMQTELLEDMLSQKEIMLNQRDTQIMQLKNALMQINIDSELSSHIGKEINVQYPFVQTFSVNNSIYMNPETLQADTIPTILITWKKRPNDTEKQQLLAWLKIRLDLDTLKLID